MKQMNPWINVKFTENVDFDTQIQTEKKENKGWAENVT